MGKKSNTRHSSTRPLLHNRNVHNRNDTNRNDCAWGDCFSGLFRSSAASGTTGLQMAPLSMSELTTAPLRFRDLPTPTGPAPMKRSDPKARPNVKAPTGPAPMNRSDPKARPNVEAKKSSPRQRRQSPLSRVREKLQAGVHRRSEEQRATVKARKRVDARLEELKAGLQELINHLHVSPSPRTNHNNDEPVWLQQAGKLVGMNPRSKSPVQMKGGAARSNGHGRNVRSH